MSNSNWLDELDAKIAREDAEDASTPDEPGVKHDITTFDGFAGTAVSPRSLDGKPYGDSLDA